jgi:hypothetical protein
MSGASGFNDSQRRVLTHHWQAFRDAGRKPKRADLEAIAAEVDGLDGGIRPDWKSVIYWCPLAVITLMTRTPCCANHAISAQYTQRLLASPTVTVDGLVGRLAHHGDCKHIAPT